MRIHFKGGTWSNTEDQALLAGVQKYGHRNWPKIASLIPRKNAENCRMRWEEWLSPNIKKDDWTTDEDKKLLRLAQAFRSQWRTIASQIEGRTAGMCEDRYKELLERAENDGELSKAFEDQRRKDFAARPEAMPARKDEIDDTGYDAQVKEELLARLSNQKGKKGLRKERSAQLEETQFRANLQRRRELLEAGALSVTQQGKINREAGRVGEQQNADDETADEFMPKNFDEVWAGGQRQAAANNADGKVRVAAHNIKRDRVATEEGSEGLSGGLALPGSEPAPAKTAAAPSGLSFNLNIPAPQGSAAASTDAKPRRMMPQGLRKAAEPTAPAPAGGALQFNLGLPAPKAAAEAAPSAAPAAAAPALSFNLPQPSFSTGVSGSTLNLFDLGIPSKAPAAQPVATKKAADEWLAYEAPVPKAMQYAAKLADAEAMPPAQRRTRREAAPVADADQLAVEEARSMIAEETMNMIAHDRALAVASSSSAPAPSRPLGIEKRWDSLARQAVNAEVACAGPLPNNSITAAPRVRFAVAPFVSSSSWEAAPCEQLADSYAALLGEHDRLVSQRADLLKAAGRTEDGRPDGLTAARAKLTQSTEGSARGVVAAASRATDASRQLQFYTSVTAVEKEEMAVRERDAESRLKELQRR